MPLNDFSDLSLFDIARSDLQPSYELAFANNSRSISKMIAGQPSPEKAVVQLVLDLDDKVDELSQSNEIEEIILPPLGNIGSSALLAKNNEVLMKWTGMKAEEFVDKAKRSSRPDVHIRIASNIRRTPKVIGRGK